MSPTYDALKLPSHIKTILVSGAGGFVGQELVKLLLELFPDVKLIATDIIEPPRLIDDEKRFKAIKADLGHTSQVEALFEGEQIGGVFALHGIMSGGAEANFDLGYAVNVDSNLNLLKQAHSHANEHAFKPTYVFVSSLAVYGGPKAVPESRVIPQDTPVIAKTSYGIQKQIMEMYVYDYGRKGYLDTRSIRLPSVTIRPGAPSTAASSFLSGIVREPLQGVESICPIASSIDDPILDSMPWYCTRTKTLVRNVAYAMCMPETEFKKYEGLGRSINLPGIKVMPRQMIDALVEHGGKDKLKLVKFEKDQAVIDIASTWAGDYDSSPSESMGFENDDPATGYSMAVKDFKELLEAQGKLA
ncbi:hypothetical protein BD324DRAFT_591288 [Kockovaella imperatae]|uniref:NAD-dependent epimerase/dehydratase domain-containing protein n=1 Tax=Kockovaella imperatae TaxID=4999 RepID=A0A1Y1UHG1_9TREE|nr:hypothetical protein BD324DRAFT_591288 [Kockovaella imperatae]ORX36914.1 hypothetical protein BD324DRAFT_591288 [Kockovaella imperatae]